MSTARSAPSKLAISPVRAQLSAFREEKRRAHEAVLSDNAERTRHAIGNHSWLLLYRLLDVPGAHAEADKRFPIGTVAPIETEVLFEKDSRGWTILHAMCFHGAPANICVHAIRLIMTKVLEEKAMAEQDAYSSDSQPDEDDNGPDDDFNPFAVLKDQKKKEEPEEQRDLHPLAATDSTGNNILHLLHSRATTEGDGMGRIKRGEHRRILAITRTVFAVEPQLASQKNMNGHTPFHEMILSSGASGQIDLSLLKIFHRVYPSCCADPFPSGRLPLHELCLRNSNSNVVAAVLKMYPEAARKRDLRKKRTPLHYILMNKDASIPTVRMLMEEFPEAVNIVDSYGRNPLLISIIAGGPVHPPPMALMGMVKGDSEWSHPVPLLYRTFDWYAAGTAGNPHVIGKDFDGTDLSTPAVRTSSKINPAEVALNKQNGSQVNHNDPRRHVRRLVKERMPGRFQKLALQVISPKRKIKTRTVKKQKPQKPKLRHPKPVKFTFDWYAKGHTQGPDFLGETGLTELATKLRESLGTEDNTSRNIRHNMFQLGSTITAKRRSDMIESMNLSPRLKRSFQNKVAESRDLDSSLLREASLRNPLSVPYFQQPVLLRRETPVEQGGGVHRGRAFGRSPNKARKTFRLPDSTLRVPFDGEEKQSRILY